jgi:hypothetical protein
MASQADYFKVKKKKPEASTETTTDAPTAVGRENLQRSTAEGDRARARQSSLQATGAARLQEASANAGSYAGLGLAERAAAERMVRSGEAKTRDEAAGMLRKKKQPKQSASEQADALEK